MKLFLVGWRPHRNVWARLNLPPRLELFPEAKRVVSEFGNLKFGQPSETIVNLDPAVGNEIAEQIKAYQGKIGSRLYPVGFFEHQDRYYLLVDETGIVYTLGGAPEPLDPWTREPSELEPLASCFERALELVVRGRVDQCEMEQDLKSVGMLGRVWELRPEGGSTSSA